MEPLAVVVEVLDAPDAARSAALELLRRRAETCLQDRRGGPELLEDLVGHRAGDAGGSTTFTCLARLGTSPAGFLCADYDPDGHRARVEALFVLPELRGIGVGHELLETAIVRLRRSGCDRLDAVALPGDRATKNFFEDHGMRARALVVSRALDGDDGRG